MKYWLTCSQKTKLIKALQPLGKKDETKLKLDELNELSDPQWNISVPYPVCVTHSRKKK